MTSITAGFYLTIYSISGMVILAILFLMLQQTTLDIAGSMFEFFTGQPILSIILILSGYIVKKINILRRIQYFDSTHWNPIKNIVFGPTFFGVGVYILIQLPQELPDLGSSATNDLFDITLSLFTITTYIGLLTICGSLIVNGAARTALNGWTLKTALIQLSKKLRYLYIQIFRRNIIFRYWEIIKIYKNKNGTGTIRAILNIFVIGANQIDPGILVKHSNRSISNQSKNEDSKSKDG